MLPVGKPGKRYKDLYYFLQLYSNIQSTQLKFQFKKATGIKGKEKRKDRVPNSKEPQQEEVKWTRSCQQETEKKQSEAKGENVSVLLRNDNQMWQSLKRDFWIYQYGSPYWQY